MHPLRVVIQFFLIAVCAYVLLIVRWPGVRETYRDAYLSVGRTLFARFGDGGLVNFKPLAGDPMNDAVIEMGRRGVTSGQSVQVHTGRIAYTPTALVLALIVATPIPWRRKGWGLLWGLILVNLFTVARIWSLLTYSYCRDVPYRLYDPSPFWAKLLTGFHEFFFVAPTCTFLVPAFIWVLVSLRREDLARIKAGVRSLTGGHGRA